MKKYNVAVREVYISHREVEVPDGTSLEEILKAAEDFEDDYLEYSHTLDSEYTTIEEIPLSNDAQNSGR